MRSIEAIRCSMPVALLGLIVALPAAATVIHVPQDESSIAAAIALAAEGDTIQLAAGVFDEPVELQSSHDVFPSRLVVRGLGMFTTEWRSSYSGAEPCLSVLSDGSLDWTIESIGFVQEESPGFDLAVVLIGSEAGGSCTLSSCRFETRGDAVQGRSDLVVTGCVFHTPGGPVNAIEMFQADLDVAYCTFDGGGFTPAIASYWGGSIRVANSIFDSVSADVEATFGGGASVNPDVVATCNCLFDVDDVNVTHEHAIEADPQFCGDYGSRNWSLQSDSPCANDAWCGQIGARGIGCGTVADGEESWGGLRARFH